VRWLGAVGLHPVSKLVFQGNEVMLRDTTDLIPISAPASDMGQGEEVKADNSCNTALSGAVIEECSASAVIGMPHMAFGGLSENWLLRAIGENHWNASARCFGLKHPDFRDQSSRRLYASFVAVRLRELSLSEVREFDDLKVTYRLSRVADAQLASKQELRCNGRSVGSAEMLSSFMTRKIEGCNRTVERGKIVRTGNEATEMASVKSELRENFRLMRADSWTSHLGFFRDNRKALERFRVRPCPNNDFNGARFLYFANFQSLVDRAEWEWFGQCSPLYSTVSRDLFYHGNINLGENVTVYMQGFRHSDQELAHWCEVIRDEDGARLANIFTKKKPLGGLNGS